MQNTNCDLRSFLPDKVALVKAPTHDPEAELVIENGVDRSLRHCMKALCQRMFGKRIE